MDSILLGAALGLFYDLFRILRIALPHHTVAVLVEDVLFWSISAFITFFFFLALDDGQIRAFLLLGEGLGFTLYYFSLGMLVIGAAKKIVEAVRWILNLIYRLLIAPIFFIFYRSWKLLCEIKNKCSFYILKQAKISNSHLKNIGELLYNDKTRKPKKQRRKGRRANESCERTKA